MYDGRMNRDSTRSALGPVLDFMGELWALDHALAARGKELVTRFGITESQRLVLRIVGQTPGLSAGSVAGVLHVHPSTLTPLLHELTRRKLLRRAPDPRDGRRIILSLTARGRRIDDASLEEVDSAVRGALGQFPPSHVVHARRLLQAVARALDDVPGQTARPSLRARSRKATSRALGTAAVAVLNPRRRSSDDAKGAPVEAAAGEARG